VNFFIKIMARKELKMDDVGIETIEINGIEYVKKTDTLQHAELLDGMQYVLVRTYSAGVHVGYLKDRKGKEVKLLHAIRIHYWDGAASLSQLAVDGVSKPQNCRFSVAVPSIELTEAIEIIPCTAKAQKNIKEVPSWKI